MDFIIQSPLSVCVATKYHKENLYDREEVSASSLYFFANYNFTLTIRIQNRNFGPLFTLLYFVRKNVSHCVDIVDTNGYTIENKAAFRSRVVRESCNFL